MDPHSATPAELTARNEADRAGMPYLVLRDGAGEQRIVPLEASCDRISIGRGEDAEVSLPWDTEVSHVHAIVERVGDGWAIVDDGLSLNGTLLNGKPLNGRRRLKNRDQIVVGGTVLAFRDPAQRRTQSTSPAAQRPPGLTPHVSDGQRRVLVALCRPFAAGSRYPAPATNEEIAAELVLSIDTVKTHLKALMQRFELDDVPRPLKRVRLVERAFDAGVITDADFAKDVRGHPSG